MITALQLTDSHLFADDNATLLDVPTNKNFYKTLERIKQQKIDFDFILLTGDLSQDGTATSYQILRDKLASLKKPIYWIPGNHDNVGIAREILSQSPLFHEKNHLQLLDWNFIFLDTTMPQQAEGHLNQEQLTALTEQLATVQGWTVIVMHHHPLPTGTPLIDRYILQEHERFWQTIVPYSQVRLVICGHVHGGYHWEHDDIAVESAPATCLQFPQGAITKNTIERKIGYNIYKFDTHTYEVDTYLWDF